jgi:hypothetical protein
VTGQETFEVAAAVAGVSIGLAAILLLALLAVIGTWRLFQRATEASLASTRAALSMEDMARRLASRPEPPVRADDSAIVELRQQAEVLIEGQRRLQETARSLLETAAAGAGPGPVAINDLESAVGRLDATVGQMAASLANLIQLLEGQQERW